MESLKILHLSDIHISENITDFEEIPFKIGGDIDEQMHNFSNTINTVLVTGDIFDGRSNHTDKLIKNGIMFFSKLLEMLNGC